MKYFLEHSYFSDHKIVGFTLQTLGVKRGQGYWLKAKANAELDISGYTLPGHTFNIELQKGWNLVTFPYDFPDGFEGLSPISDQLLIIKDESQSYDPLLPGYLNTLKRIEPGKGYWLKVSENCVLSF